MTNVVKFIYDREKDLQVYEGAFVKLKYPTYGREMKINSSVWAIQKLAREKPVEEQFDFIKSELEIFTNKNKRFISDGLSSLQKEWDMVEGRYIARLEEYFNLKVDYKIIGYLTTVSISPYNPRDKYFFPRFESSVARQLTTSAHEIMHIVYRTAYDDLLTKRGMSKQDILEINEAMTTIINLRFSDLFVLPDLNNKPTAKDLRDKIKEMYREDLDFSVILDELIRMRA